MHAIALPVHFRDGSIESLNRKCIYGHSYGSPSARLLCYHGIHYLELTEISLANPLLLQGLYPVLIYILIRLHSIAGNSSSIVQLQTTKHDSS
jgi:hypothetical protein